MNKVKRATNIDLIKRYKVMRDAGMSYGEIIKVLGKSKKQYQRWNNYLKRGVLTYPQSGSGQVVDR